MLQSKLGKTTQGSSPTAPLNFTAQFQKELNVGRVRALLR